MYRETENGGRTETGVDRPVAGHDRRVQIDEAEIDEIFADIDQCRLPGAAVGIAVNGVPVYRKGFGLASIELPVLLSPSIRLRVFSGTKHFACLGYMLLCEDGVAALDDPIGRFLPELHPVTRRATMRHLMGHVSGLRDAKDICLRFCGTGRAVSSEDLFSYYLDIDDTNAPPGTTWSYNNGGYLLLTLAIERITGQPFEDVLRSRIFEPVGMHDTLVRRWDTDFVPNSATLHMTGADGGYERSYLGAASAGEGGIVSTVDDLLRWLAHMDDPSVGTPATWATMKAPQRLANGSSTGYGLGLMSGDYRGSPTLYHPGGGMGGNAQLLKVPTAGLDVVILVNRHDVSAVERGYRILDACLPARVADDEPARTPDMAGTYRSPSTGRVIELSMRGDQRIATIDGTDLPVVPDGDGVLRPAETFGYVKQRLTLHGDPGEAPAAVGFSDVGDIDELVPVEAASGDPSVETILGAYRSDATGTDAVVSAADQGLVLRTTGRFGVTEHDLRRLAPDIWQVADDPRTSLGGILTFDSDGAGFRYSSGRTRALPFTRRS